MSHEDKSRARQPGFRAREPGPWDTTRHMSPDPAWSAEDQLAWWSAAALVLTLNASEGCRRTAAREGDKAVAKRRAAPGKEGT